MDQHYCYRHQPGNGLRSGHKSVMETFWGQQQQGIMLDGTVIFLQVQMLIT
jgi:hypothetical protein